jgi:hypothetical protein
MFDRFRRHSIQPNNFDQLSKSDYFLISPFVFYIPGWEQIHIIFQTKSICGVWEALRAGLRSGNAEVRAFFWQYLPGICADLGLTSPELPHTEAAVCLGLFADRFLLFFQGGFISFLFLHSISPCSTSHV